MKELHEQLIQAVSGNDEFRVKALLSEDKSLINAEDTEGRTPLLLALFLGHEDLARGIWELNPHPSLFEAAAYGDADVLQNRILQAPECVDAVANDGYGIIGLSVFFGRQKATEVLLDAGAEVDRPAMNAFKVHPINSAAANRDGEKSLTFCKLLLEAGANPNVAQAGGWTPLHQAAALGRKEIVELLLSHGASADAISDDDRTPAALAEVKGHEEIQKILEEAQS